MARLSPDDTRHPFLSNFPCTAPCSHCRMVIKISIPPEPRAQILPLEESCENPIFSIHQKPGTEVKLRRFDSASSFRPPCLHRGGYHVDTLAQDPRIFR